MNVALVMAVPPIPIGLFVVVVALVEIHLVPMSVVFPLGVISNFSVPRVIVAVIGIVNAHMRRTAGVEHWGR